MYGNAVFTSGTESLVSVGGQHVVQVPIQVQRGLVPGNGDYGHLPIHGHIKGSHVLSQDQLTRQGQTEAHRQMTFAGRMPGPGQLSDQYQQGYSLSGYQYVSNQQGYGCDPGMSSGGTPAAMDYVEMQGHRSGQAVVQSQIMSPRHAESYGKMMMPMTGSNLSGMVQQRAMHSPAAAVTADAPKVAGHPSVHPVHQTRMVSSGHLPKHEYADIYPGALYNTPRYSENCEGFAGYDLQHLQHPRYPGAGQPVQFAHAPSMGMILQQPTADSVHFAYGRPGSSQQSHSGMYRWASGWADASNISSSINHVDGSVSSHPMQWQHPGVRLNNHHQQFPDYSANSGTVPEFRDRTMNQISPGQKVLYNASQSQTEIAYPASAHSTWPYTSVQGDSATSSGFALPRIDDTAIQHHVNMSSTEALVNSSFSPKMQALPSKPSPKPSESVSSYGMWTTPESVVYSPRVAVGPGLHAAKQTGVHSYRQPYQQYSDPSLSHYPQSVHQYPPSGFSQVPVNQSNWYQIKEKTFQRQQAAAGVLYDKQATNMQFHIGAPGIEGNGESSVAPHYVSPGLSVMRDTSCVGASESVSGHTDYEKFKSLVTDSGEYGWPAPCTVSKPASETMPVRFSTQAYNRPGLAEGQILMAGEKSRSQPVFMDCHVQNPTHQQVSPLPSCNVACSQVVSVVTTTTTSCVPHPPATTTLSSSSLPSFDPATSSASSFVQPNKSLSPTQSRTDTALEFPHQPSSPGLTNTLLSLASSVASKLAKSSKRSASKKKRKKMAVSVMSTPDDSPAKELPVVEVAAVLVKDPSGDVGTALESITDCVESKDLSGCNPDLSVVVPYGWKRSFSNGAVVYHSPTEVQLSSLAEVRQYLLSDGTCKCGLHCPLDVEQTFIFDQTRVNSKHLTADDMHLDLDRASNLCNHRRKNIAMATFQQSTGLHFSWQDASTLSETSKVFVPPMQIQAPNLLDNALLYDQQQSATDVKDTRSSQYMTKLNAAETTGGEDDGFQSAKQRSVVGFPESIASLSSNLKNSGAEVISFPTMPREFLGSARQVTGASYFAGDSSTGALMSYGYHSASERPQCVSSANAPYSAFDSWSLAASRNSAASASKKSKKRSRTGKHKDTYGSMLDRNMSCPNIDVRQIIQEQRERIQMELTASGRPRMPFQDTSTTTDSLPVSIMTHQSTTVNESLANVGAWSHSLEFGNRDAAGNQPNRAEQFEAWDVASTSVMSAAVSRNRDAAGNQPNRAEQFEAWDVASTWVLSAAVSSTDTHTIEKASAVAVANPHGTTNVLEGALYPTSSSVSSHHLQNSGENTVVTYSLTSDIVSPLSTSTWGSDALSVKPMNMGANTANTQFSTFTSCKVDSLRNPVQIDAHRLQDLQAGCSLPRNSLIPPCSSASSGNWLTSQCNEASPIQMVQNMVTELATTQNSLALTASLILRRSESGTRRRKATQIESTASRNTPAHDMNTQMETTHMDSSNQAHVELQELCSLSSGSVLGSNTVKYSSSSKLSQSEPSNELLPELAAKCAAGSVSPAVDVDDKLQNQDCEVPTGLDNLAVGLSSASSACTSLTYVSSHLASTGASLALSTSGLPSAQSSSVVQLPLNSLSPRVVSSSSDAPGVVVAVMAVSTAAMHAPCTKVRASCDMSNKLSQSEPSNELLPELAAEGAAGSVSPTVDVDDKMQNQDCEVPLNYVDTFIDNPMCTTGTQTSTPSSGLSAPSSVDSDSQDVCESPLLSTANRSSVVSSSTVDDATATKHVGLAVTSGNHPDLSSMQSSSVCAVQGTSPQVVMVPPMQQTPFVLPPTIAFASGPVVGHSFLQLPHPNDYGSFGLPTSAACVGGVVPSGTVSLVHFAPGSVVGSAVGNMISTAINEPLSSSQSNPVHFVAPVKSDSGVFSSGEFIQLVAPAALPTGHIFVQNLMPGITSFGHSGATLVPFVQPTALCNPSALFTVGHGPLGLSLGGALAFGPAVLDPRSGLREPAPDPPDSTVNNETDEQSSDDSADVDRVTSSGPEMFAKNQFVPTLMWSSNIGITGSGNVVNSNCRATTGDVTAEKTDYDGAEESALAKCSSPREESRLSDVGLFLPRAKSKFGKAGRRRFVRKSRRASCLRLVPKSSSTNSSGDCSQVGTDCSKIQQDKDLLPVENYEVPGNSENPQIPANSDCRVSTTLSSDDLVQDSVPQPRGRQLRSSQKHHWNKQTVCVVDCTSQQSRSCSSESQPQETDDGADSTTGASVPGSPRTFNIGDLIWGPSRGFPSWPGKLVSSEAVRSNVKLENGKIWVKWFGANTFTQEEPSQLKTLSEGLDTHHNARKKCRQGRKMNASLEAAIQEAMSELDSQSDEQTQRHVLIRPSGSASGLHDRAIKSRVKKKSRK